MNPISPLKGLSTAIGRVSASSCWTIRRARLAPGKIFRLHGTITRPQNLAGNEFLRELALTGPGNKGLLRVTKGITRR